MSELLLVGNIQRFCLHDGPGIRTTVFLKGCPLKCPWCCNPENIKTSTEFFRGKEYGSYLTAEEVYSEVVKDLAFYEDGGGVTFSGGEPLVQAKALAPLLRRLTLKGVDVCLETSLFSSRQQLEALVELVSLFYVDIKILDPLLCRRLLGGDVAVYLDNLKYLHEMKRRVVYRVPVIANMTDSESNIADVLSLVEQYPPARVDLLVGHDLGVEKYKALGEEPPASSVVSGQSVTSYCERIAALGVQASVCKV